MKVSDVMYAGIRGTSTTKIAVKFDCSAASPCTKITLQNVNLTYLDQAADSFCSNAFGKALGLVQPKSFKEVSGVSIIGGVLDAKGSAWWTCKTSGGSCSGGATVS